MLATFANCWNLRGIEKLTGLRRPLTTSDAGKGGSKENGDALEDHDRE